MLEGPSGGVEEARCKQMKGRNGRPKYKVRKVGKERSSAGRRSASYGSVSVSVCVSSCRVKCAERPPECGSEQDGARQLTVLEKGKGKLISRVLRWERFVKGVK